MREGYRNRCPHGWRRFLFRREYYPGNNYYGVGEILRRYAGLPPWFPLNCKIQHGVKFFRAYASPAECPNHLAFYSSPEPRCLFLMFNEPDAAFFREHGVGNVRAIGSAAVYLDGYLDRLRAEHPDPRGTIAFPCKSSTSTDVVMDLEAYADMLVALPERFQPVRVSLYYKDLEKGRDKPFRERGLEVRCCGTLHSQDYLWNFFANIADCRYAVSNDLCSSANYYSMYYGLRYFSYGPRVEGFEANNPGDRQYGRERMDGRAVTGHEFPMEACEDTARQRAIAEQVLGADRRLSPAALRGLLLGRLSPGFLARWTAALYFKRFRRAY
ncbi:MAG: hypothetical protein AB7D57_03215 [Desulfovibrionaceae bacterium]